LSSLTEHCYWSRPDESNSAYCPVGKCSQPMLEYRLLKNSTRHGSKVPWLHRGVQDLGQNLCSSMLVMLSKTLSKRKGYVWMRNIHKMLCAFIHRWPYGSHTNALVENEFVREEQESRKRKPSTMLHVHSVHTLENLIQRIGAVAASPSIRALKAGRGTTRPI
jgi:hypothetical protein